MVILRHKIFFLLVMAFFAAISFPLFVHGQTYMEVYGQNRIQYRKFQWKFFDTKHFRVYHYDRAGRQLGRYVAEEAEDDIATIEKKLGGQFPKRFNIILYNSYDEYRQSNIGLKDETQLNENSTAGTLNLVGDKLVVYFTGEHTDLKHQIRSGMARVVMERMIFGDNFKKMVKNALLLNLPPWVTDGYISYLVDGWDAKANSEWKSLLESRPGTGFYELSEQYPELAGKAFWKFVSTQYGTNTVKRLLYSMQQKTSLNKAMKEKDELNLKVTKAYDSCIAFYKSVYKADAGRQETPDSTKGLISLKVPKDNTIIQDIRVSPRGSDIAYVAWKDGKYSVFVEKTSKEKELSTLLEGGQKDLTEQMDPNYPLLAWSNTGNKLAVLYKKGSLVQLKVFNSQSGRIENYVIPKNRFDRVLGMTFMQDDDRMIFSAIRKSQTDLYMFTIKGSKMTNITDDAWDDISPEFVSGGSRTGILFLSNRPKPTLDVPVGVNELPTGPMNVFFYNTKTMSTELVQCSDMKTGHVAQPIQYGLDNFAYLYDGNGINNKYVVLFARNKHNEDSAYSVPITNYNTSIICHQYNVASGEVADVVQEKDEYKVYFHSLLMPGKDVPVKTLAPTLLSVEKPATKTDIKSKDNKLLYNKGRYFKDDDDTAETEIKGGNEFQTEFSDTTRPVRRAKNRANKIHNGENNAGDSSLLTEMTDSAYVKMKPTPYRLSFKPDALTIQADNSLLFEQYQSIAANGGQFINPSLSGLATVSLNELMEDYRITAGFQLPIDVSGSTYFLQYQNFRNKTDWGLLFLSTQNKQEFLVPPYDAPELFKTVTNILQSDFSFPLDRVRSIRFHSSLRQDRLIEKATDSSSLDNPYTTTTYTSMSRLEYVFDNTISPAMNIRNGTRFKFYGEYLYGLNNGNRSCYNFGTDIRNYQKLYKNFILANRLAYAHSDGNNEVEYLMGGVDNWISPQTAANAGQGPAPNYGFQALSTPLRGYDQYARTGNNFFVFNTELRLPVLTTFLKRPIQSAILKNLQVVAFLDAGDAWTGFLPDAASMSSNYSYPAPGAPPGNVFLNLTVPNSGGLAVGSGGGLRTSLFGYFIRFDAAWNIEGIRKPVIYFALGTDF
jgi:hypothetical protein